MKISSWESRKGKICETKSRKKKPHGFWPAKQMRQIKRSSVDHTNAPNKHKNKKQIKNTNQHSPTEMDEDNPTKRHPTVPRKMQTCTKARPPIWEAVQNAYLRNNKSISPKGFRENGRVARSHINS